MSEIVTVKVVMGKGWEGFRRETLLINEEEVMDVGPLSECPEDAILERDLVGPSDIAELLENFLIEHKGKKVKFVYEDEEDSNE
ncbi:hypothetical protein [Bacillus atrophaeus]|uniref:hypothetical protein n=1 Tax=Bacillus atrophaeus TaxID=1452 RepID=UPI0022825ACC|nr:hypothetical protein [Bacillus atrophaeus]MCY8513511.1 hypothetical protein [Bacillus atrophaeus]MCY8992615.1 hypothetical protein [Bacillus atrophaeus]MCY9162700.1 hypothetical protein [Bacillus atrophaeus]MEC0765702.1 hypothetical protein [Bacillus atrophaeus]MEC0781531.1 hypothetical protein [Bacillus atrophaeus]